MHNELPDEERELLSSELLSIPTSRVYVAVTAGPPLDIWASLRTLAMIASLLGAPVTLPGASSEPSNDAGDVGADERENAKAALRKRSVIASLPE